MNKDEIYKIHQVNQLNITGSEALQILQDLVENHHDLSMFDIYESLQKFRKQCPHKNAERTPSHDRDGTWYCFDCRETY